MWVLPRGLPTTPPPSFSYPPARYTSVMGSRRLWHREDPPTLCSLPLCIPRFFACEQSVNPNTLAAALGGSTYRDTSAASEAASFRDGMPPPSKGTITSYPLEACVVLLVRQCTGEWGCALPHV
jgi:hypothetical protein